MVNLIKNILATICYYDVLDYPLTSFEVWKYLIKSGGQEGGGNGQKCSLGEVSKELENSALKNFVEEFQGFYFLKGKRHLIGERIKRGKISVLKIKRLRRVVYLLRFIPFVRMVGVTGRLAMKNAQEESDWDLLTVLKKNRIWTGRTLVTLAAHLLGKRRYGNKIRDRVCLNYFITDDSLEIKTKDLFSANEYSFCFPLFGAEEYKKFQIKNSWIKKNKPNYYIAEQENLKTIKDTKCSRLVRTLGEKLFGWDFLENRLRTWEEKKIMSNPKTHQEGSMVEASDEALIFLPSPQGPKVFEEFKERVNKL